MIFASRVGFSGTPSDLLPISLRTWQYEEGTTAKVVRTFLDPAICASEVRVLEGALASRKLLDRAGGGEFHALVDSGALITGLTNREIAAELVRRLPPTFDAVAYIDDRFYKIHHYFLLG